MSEDPGFQSSLCFCLADALCLCLVKAVTAQNAPRPGQSNAPELQTPTEAAQQSACSPTKEAKPEEKSEKDGEKTDSERDEHHRGAVVVAPLPIVSPAIGSGIVPIAGYIFPFQAKDAASPPSVVGVAGLITNNDSRGFALGAEIYLKQARYELKSLYARGNLDYNLYGVGYADGNSGRKLPLEQTGQMFFIEFMRNIGWNVFAGGRFSIGNSFITLKPTTGETPPIPPDVGLQTNLRALGLEVVRDSRLNRFYPVKGSLVDFTADLSPESSWRRYTYEESKFRKSQFASEAQRRSQRCGRIPRGRS